MNRLQIGAILHFIIALGHVVCLFFLDKAFEAYGIKDLMYNLVGGNEWLLYLITIFIILYFFIAGLYALSANGNIKTLPFTKIVIISIIIIYMLRMIFGLGKCFVDFKWLQFISSLLPGFIAWCYLPGIKK
ncbi:MAG: hypothetical protein MJ211_04855 [Bacteroidales bacterium]|nr:hypothetical protein [Bacteroidales bacterium]